MGGGKCDFTALWDGAISILSSAAPSAHSKFLEIRE